MKKFLKYCLIVVLLVVGLALIFNQQIKNALVSHMTTSAVSTTVVKPQQNSKKANFDFKKIKAVDSQMVVSAATSAKMLLSGKLRCQVLG